VTLNPGSSSSGAKLPAVRLTRPKPQPKKPANTSSEIQEWLQDEIAQVARKSGHSVEEIAAQFPNSQDASLAELQDLLHTRMCRLHRRDERLKQVERTTSVLAVILLAAFGCLAGYEAHLGHSVNSPIFAAAITVTACCLILGLVAWSRFNLQVDQQLLGLARTALDNVRESIHRLTQA
jgi:phosphoribosyl-ATP pyrophosphohydrolase